MKFFVDNAQTIFTLVGALILYVYHQTSAHIPAQQRAYIEQFTSTAVLTVEQRFAGHSNEEKKALAMNEVKGFFKAFNLPIPPDDVLSAFIEAAVNALPPTTPQIARTVKG